MKFLRVLTRFSSKIVKIIENIEIFLKFSGGVFGLILDNRRSIIRVGTLMKELTRSPFSHVCDVTVAGMLLTLIFTKKRKIMIREFFKKKTIQKLPQVTEIF